MAIYHPRPVLFARLHSKYRIAPVIGGWFNVVHGTGKKSAVAMHCSTAPLAVFWLRHLQQSEKLE